MITLTFQLASSLLQPVVGYWTDKYPMPWSLPIGMCFTLSGLVLLALAGSFGAVLLAAALVGPGSSVFHPESSRVARMASGGRHGLAQSIFQVGGNFGSSLDLLAAVIIAPYGKGNVAWFVLAALLAIVVLAQISRWYLAQHPMIKENPKRRLSIHCRATKWYWRSADSVNPHFLEIFLYGEHQQLLHLLSDAKIRIIYPECSASSVCLPVCRCGRYGDRRACRDKNWTEICDLGLYPRRCAVYADFTLREPAWTGVLTVIIGFILASAFSAILVYVRSCFRDVSVWFLAFFGFAFGMGGRERQFWGLSP
ncbi:MFS transporter [Escherichia coli]